MSRSIESMLRSMSKNRSNVSKRHISKKDCIFSNEMVKDIQKIKALNNPNDLDFLCRRFSKEANYIYEYNKYLESEHNKIEYIQSNETIKYYMSLEEESVDNSEDNNEDKTITDSATLSLGKRIGAAIISFLMKAIAAFGAFIKRIGIYINQWRKSFSEGIYNKFDASKFTNIEATAKVRKLNPAFNLNALTNEIPKIFEYLFSTTSSEDIKSILKKMGATTISNDNKYISIDLFQNISEKIITTLSEKVENLNEISKVEEDFSDIVDVLKKMIDYVKTEFNNFINQITKTGNESLSISSQGLPKVLEIYSKIIAEITNTTYQIIYGSLGKEIEYAGQKSGAFEKPKPETISVKDFFSLSKPGERPALLELLSPASSQILISIRHSGEFALKTASSLLKEIQQIERKFATKETKAAMKTRQVLYNFLQGAISSIQPLFYNILNEIYSAIFIVAKMIKLGLSK